MRSSLQSLWRANLLLYLGLFLHCGEARVNTEAPSGPLYRVVGTPLYISCNVSGFSNADMKKQFEYTVVKPGSRRTENIISSRDPGFGYASYLRRIERKEISLTHISANLVLFEIPSLMKSDEGEYECTVINADTNYDGAYSAKTSVKVIDNSLSVSSPAPTSQSYNEGDAFTSTCQASSNTIQHTHLSFAWYLHRDGEENAQPIISLDRYFTLSPGPGFEERYQAGHISLDKIGEATYKLKMAELQLSDQGRVFCQAQEWIQEPDRSWYSIVQREAEATTLTIKAREVLPDTMSLVVSISMQSGSLQVGQKLSISCKVNTQNSEDGLLSVAWWKGGVELARMGPTGILSVGQEYIARKEELSITRISDKDFNLKLQPVRIEDQGDYKCKAWPQKRGQDGAFIQGAAQDSTHERIDISATESRLSVEMQNEARVNENDALKLTCRVHGYRRQLSVTWQRKSTRTSSSSVFTPVISLSQEGVTAKAAEFESRMIKAWRPAANTFILELDGVTPSDSGDYQCAVSEWENNDMTNSHSQTTSVTVVESSVRVTLTSRENRVTIGENVDLMCRVRNKNVPVTVTWTVQREAIVDNILTVYSDGTISWSGGQSGYQLKVQKSENGDIHYLSINGASKLEAGRYQCIVSQDSHKRPTESNWLAVEVETPASKLSLTSAKMVTTYIDADVQLKCSVSSGASSSSRYAVTWKLEQKGEMKDVVSLDQDATVTFGPEIEPSQRQRISVKHTKGPSFELAIRQAWFSDNGSYICIVKEWLQDPRGGWYQLPPKNETITLIVIESEQKLAVSNKDGKLNVSSSQDFTIPCHITEQSNKKSEFQVTWFRNNTLNEQRPVFTAYRNSTLQDRYGKKDKLRFGHASSNHYSLTVLEPNPEDSGLYFCEVEEWIQSLSHGWRKIATKQSGILTVYVYGKGNSGASTDQGCNLGTWIGILVAFIICSLLVIFLLVLKICRSNVSGGKKSNQSLWTEQHPLNTKPSAED
ncbi:immunoglobulin superfamily member 2-like [Xyrichtys novacula]|nr:immunoglobulin superfamily member 2-like [Xyrichtys novacula]